PSIGSPSTGCRRSHSAPRARSPTVCATMSRWRDHGLYDRPFGIGQITGVTKATAVRRKAVFGCPHRALLKRESSARKGRTPDSSDSRPPRSVSQIWNLQKPQNNPRRCAEDRCTHELPPSRVATIATAITTRKKESNKEEGRKHERRHCPQPCPHEE